MSPGGHIEAISGSKRGGNQMRPLLHKFQRSYLLAEIYSPDERRHNNQNLMSSICLVLKDTRKRCPFVAVESLY